MNLRSREWLAAALLLGLLAGLGAPAASAHGTGTGTITSSASFVLTPWGTNTSMYHGYLASIGLPIGPGDTLQFSWQVSGTAPPIHFEIHGHPSTGGFVMYYNVTAVRVDDSWVVPNSDGFMVLWENPNSMNETVSYVFRLIPPAPDPIPYLISVGLVAAAVLVVLRIRRWRSTKRRDDVEGDSKDAVAIRRSEAELARARDPPPP